MDQMYGIFASCFVQSGDTEMVCKSSTAENLKIRKEKNIQEQFRRKLGLLIDVMKQGVGTSNDGNTARRFFENPSVTAEITGLDEIIIRKFSILLQAIASGEEIDPEKFDIFAKNLAKLVIEKYGWYYMPASVHKILFHGANIIRHVLLPIGQLSEEVIEARHKEFRRFRLNNARKKSRRCTNEDIMFSLLISSDPYISNLRHSSRSKSKKKMFPETLELFRKRTDEEKNNETSDISMSTDDEQSDESI